MGRLGDCVRCFDTHPATTLETVVVGGDRYELPLCERQADRLQQELWGWARIGRLVDDTPPRAKPKDDAEVSGSRWGGTVVASHVHVPQFSDPEPAIAPVVARQASGLPVFTQAPVLAQPPAPVIPQPAAPEPPPRKRSDPALPRGYEEWRFTAHALERMGERQLRREQVLWAALQPTLTMPSPNPSAKIHKRGSIQVIVNPTEKRIITVYDRDAVAEEELAHAAAR